MDGGNGAIEGMEVTLFAEGKPKHQYYQLSLFIPTVIVTEYIRYDIYIITMI